jgi:hypothetical protein
MGMMYPTLEFFKKKEKKEEERGLPLAPPSKN